MSAVKEGAQSAGGLVLLLLPIAFVLGDLYWLWMAIQLGSFGMFVVGMFPVTAILAAPIGAWSLLFGTPSWVIALFG